MGIWGGGKGGEVEVCNGAVGFAMEQLGLQRCNGVAKVKWGLQPCNGVCNGVMGFAMVQWGL